MNSRIRRAASCAAAPAAVGFITFVLRTIAVVNATTAGFAYLITVLLVAATWGFAESVIASVTATVTFNFFFLPPVGTWAIADPENWIALFTFLITSIIASRLSDRAKRRAAEASTRQTEMERLYELSRAIMMVDSTEPIGSHIASELARIGQIPAVAIYDRPSNAIYYGGSEQIPDAPSILRETVITGRQSKELQTRTIFAPLSLAGHSIGSIAMTGADLSNTALHALLNLIAMSLENARSREMATRAQAARQSQEFKSTLLDGLAHEFKTPLTSIRAATTALLTAKVSDAEHRQEMLTIVDQEAERLSRLVTEATQVARIEAGKIQLERHLCSIDDLVRNVLAQMEPQRDGRPVGLSIEPDIPLVSIDAGMMQLALRQLVDNALKYSPRNSPIHISSERRGKEIFIAVRNEGEPLSESERARIFDKFYRGANVKRQVAGTGMGLPIAREILVAHGGDIRLAASSDRGTEFLITIPLLMK